MSQSSRPWLFQGLGAGRDGWIIREYSVCAGASEGPVLVQSFPGASLSPGIFAGSGDCASLVPAHTWAIPWDNHCGAQGSVIPRGNYYIKALGEASKLHSCSGKSAQTMNEHLKSDNFIFLYKRKDQRKIPAGQAG